MVAYQDGVGPYEWGQQPEAGQIFHCRLSDCL